jgi:glycosyltransferase involved in cell wall biosynthesis
LLNALLRVDARNSYVGFADSATVAQGRFPPGLDVCLVEVSESPSIAAGAESRRRLTDMWQMSRAVQRAGVDVVLFPSTYTFFPVIGRTRAVVVIHDAIAEKMPELIFPKWTGRLAWTLKTRVACWQADRVITVSRAAAAAIGQYLPVRPDHLRIIYEAPDPIFKVRVTPEDRARQADLLTELSIPSEAKLVLYVGGFGPHKNVGTLIHAFAEFGRSSSTSVHLVLVGKIDGEVFHSEVEDLRKQVRELGLEPRVTFTGFVPDEDLVHLYQAAACLAMPSRDEGFGLPVVEAMACGLPVVASRAGALPELVGVNAGLLADSEKPVEWASALHRLVDGSQDERDLFISAGFARTAELSWEHAAAELVSVFDELGPSQRTAAGRPRTYRSSNA